MEEKPQQDESDGQTDAETQEGARQVRPELSWTWTGAVRADMVDVSVMRTRTRSRLPATLNVNNRKRREKR